MFIWTRTGEKLVKTDDIKVISMEDMTKQALELHPATQGEVYALRAYYTVDDRKNSIILASYSDIETASEGFAQLIRAIGNGAVVFSFCENISLSDDEKAPPEEVIGLEP